MFVFQEWVLCKMRWYAVNRRYDAVLKVMVEQSVQCLHHKTNASVVTS